MTPAESWLLLVSVLVLAIVIALVLDGEIR
jgi:hypothetical protein